MLFEPDRHEPLQPAAWNETLVRATIQEVVDDVERSCAPDASWPLHPLDDEGDCPGTGFRGVYLGGAGVLWALGYLAREGAARVSADLPDLMHRTDAAYRSHPDSGSIVPSLFLGEAGILLVSWLLTRSRATEARLYDAVHRNIANPTNEALWGAPGTMLAALHLWERTGEPRWRDLFLANVDGLWAEWRADARAGCYLWTQQLYGSSVQYLGAGHGFAGNVHPLLRGAALIDPARRETLYDRCAATLQATARAEDGGVNWPPGLAAPRPGRPQMLMQWCHGAPGIVTAFAAFPPQRSPTVDAMLAAAGRAVWNAGPLAKGHGLCHGTAGNGYAFLTLYRRTGDPLWLHRARAFAMHAIAQRERMCARHGRGRYTLWTGDPGLAVFAWHCIDGRGALPVLDVL